VGLELSSGKRFFLAYIIDEIVIGKSYLRSDWPLHITLLPWFLCDKEDELDDFLRRTASSYTPFWVEVGEEKVFGPQKDININLILPNEPLERLHKELINQVSQAGKIVADSQYIGEAYQPHIRRYGNRGKKPGQTIRIDSIYVTELIDQNYSRPVKRYNFGT
jgi:2'-5' RNA ligase